jgi:hypothetical protein
MTFPIHDTATTAQMFDDIGHIVEKHLGFFPPCFVLILTDGKQAQTLFASDKPGDMTQLTQRLVEGAHNHLKNRSRGKQN